MVSSLSTSLCEQLYPEAITTSPSQFEHTSLYSVLLLELVTVWLSVWLAVDLCVCLSLQMTSVVLELGHPSGRCAILHWTAGGGASLLTAVNHQKSRRKVELTDHTPFDQVEVVSSTRWVLDQCWVRPMLGQITFSTEILPLCSVELLHAS